MSAIHFESTYDNSKLQAGIRQDNQTVGQWAKNMQSNNAGIEQSFNRMTQAATAYLSLRFASQIGNEIIQVRGQFQQLGIAFETMLGSKEKADRIMSESISMAQKTPFTLLDITTNVKQLMAMGVETEKVMDTMKSLGDVAAGVSQPISRIAINYGQVATLGKLQQREIRDFAMAGIPLIDELAKNMGKTKDEISDMVSASKIGFPEVERAFQTMSGEGGKFYNLMEKQNASVTGQISNLTDKWQVMLNEIGKSNEGTIYGGISGLATLITHYQDILDILKVLVVTYGTYKAALMAVSAASAVSGFVDNIRLIGMFRKELGLLTATQQAFNVASKGNIYVAALAGIAGLITLLTAFGDKAKTTEDLVTDLNKSIESIGKQIEIESAISKYESLKDKVGKTKTEQDELNKSIKTLSSIFPDAIGKTDQYGKAIDLMADKLKNASKEARENAKALAESNKAESEIALKKLIAKRDQYQGDINRGTVTTRDESGTLNVDSLSKENITFRRNEIVKLNAEIEDLGKTIGNASSQIYDLASVGAEKFIEKNKSLFDEVTKYTREGALNASAQLLSMLGSDGGRADAAILKQVSELKDYANKIKTTKEETKALKLELQKAYDELKRLQNPDYESKTGTPSKDRADQKALIKELEDKLGMHEKEKKAIDELKVANEALEKAVKSGNQESITAAAKKVDALENEKRKLEEIIDLELQRAWRSQFDGQSMTQTQTKLVSPITQVGSLKNVHGILYEVTAIDKTGPVWTKVKAQYSDLKKFEKEQDKKANKEQEDQDKESNDKKKKAQEEILNDARQLTSELINQLGLSKQQSAELNGIADVLMNLTKGDYIGAAFGAASTLLTALTGSHAEDPALVALERMNELLKQQSAILANLSGTDYFQLAKIQYADLTKQIDDYTKKLQSSKITNITGASGYYDDKSTADLIDMYTSGMIKLNSTQTEWITKIIELRKEQADLMQNIFTEALGFDSSAVSDTIVTGIEDGLKLAADNSLGGFTKSFGEQIKDALVNNIKEALELKLTEGFMTDFTTFLSATSLGGTALTPDELATLEKEYASAISDSAAAMTAIQPILDKYGVGTASATAATGITSSLTEETGSLLAGLATGIRIDVKSLLDIGMNKLDLMTVGVNHLSMIEKNTNELYRLESIENELKDLNKNVKNL